MDDAEEVALLQRAKQRELAKGKAANHQRKLWHSALELRIVLQQCMQQAHKLPRNPAHSAMMQASHDVAFDVSRAAVACRRAISRMHALRRAIVVRSEDVCAVSDLTKKRKRSSSDAYCRSTYEMLNMDTDSLWQAIDDEYKAIAPFRDAALDRWYKRTHSTASSGSVLQGVAEQVDASLNSAAGRAHEKSRLPMRLLPQRIGERDPSRLNVTMKPSAKTSSHGTGTGGIESLKHEEREQATFDDGEFYQQLLKEFLESPSVQPEMVQQARNTREKRKKQYQKKASRDRKLRYTVHPQIVNFTTPSDDNPHSLAPHLFQNLLGQYDSENAKGLPQMRQQDE